MAKFNVGDRVIGNDAANKRYTITRKGWRGVVTKIISGDCIYVKGPTPEGRDFEYSVNPGCFDLLEGNKIVITRDGKTTTARLFNGKELIKKAEAKCSPEDKFDFMVGAKLAMDRLEDKPEAREPKYKVGQYVKITGRNYYGHCLEIGSYGRIRRVDRYDTYEIDGYDTDGTLRQTLHPDDFELA